LKLREELTEWLGQKLSPIFLSESIKGILTMYDFTFSEELPFFLHTLPFRFRIPRADKEYNNMRKENGKGTRSIEAEIKPLMKRSPVTERREMKCLYINPTVEK
jgi:hypothetical protein